ncbi:MAG: hypothetical protein JWR61_1548 [Ferruginibacter sp.]|nr:hypothetical protein [Ferruginibacter sp.]
MMQSYSGFRPSKGQFDVKKGHAGKMPVANSRL